MTRIITLLAALLSTLFVGCAHVTKTPAPRSVIESELPTPNMADMAQHLFDESLDHFGGVEGLRRELADLEAEGETPFVVVTLYHDGLSLSGAMRGECTAVLYRLVQSVVPNRTVAVADRFVQMAEPGKLQVTTRVDWADRRK